jgi:hypothetical protein
MLTKPCFLKTSPLMRIYTSNVYSYGFSQDMTSSEVKNGKDTMKTSALEMSGMNIKHSEEEIQNLRKSPLRYPSNILHGCPTSYIRIYKFCNTVSCPGADAGSLPYITTSNILLACRAFAHKQYFLNMTLLPV